MTQTAASRAAVSAPSSERREEMLRVASALLHERGLQVSLQDIADQLGVTYNALYNHFKNRDDLLLQCLVRSTVMLREHVESSIAAGGTGLEQVLRFVRSFVEATAKDKVPSGRLLVALSVDAQRTLFRAGHEGRELLRGIVDSGIADGSIAPTDVLIATTWILHTIYWWPEEVMPHRRPAMVTDTVCELFRRGLATP